MNRIDGRTFDQLRPIEIIPDINKFAEGSCLIRCGNTHVLCTASVEDKPPRHVPEGEGWVTAEYSMLPRANRERSRRDISKLKLSPRSAEIQRLVGRSLRAVVDMKKLGPWNITVDCDVLQGDGGTRTASITGGFVAMMLAFRKMKEEGLICEIPVSGYVAAVSAGIVENQPLLENAGLEIADFGGNTVVLRAVPADVEPQNAENLLIEIADKLMKGGHDALNEHTEWVLHSISCRAAIKAGDKSSPQELLALADKILSGEVPPFCPHGRPCVLKLTRKELEKQFGRIV